ncbi:hypothetical protein C8A03DRAFT_38995 [Achaetomium macrosporum]|uniref:Uncharacterized protein n=1 Tax=Achaetomium macrosporum TaxID=79813 RepID=A0AAN7H9U6_9PEZI|nr:hypothetical protein C8A03DRAFT_38995 [Achaetomium macrosporum]
MDMIDCLKPGETVAVAVEFQVSELVEELTTGSMYISPSYGYNPSTRFLLVANASTPNTFVQQIIHFIQSGLRLPVDQQDGHPPRQHHELLPDGTREPWELMDVAHVFTLAREGTGFLVVAPSNMTSLRGFAHLLAMPGKDALESVSSDESTTTVMSAAAYAQLRQKHEDRRTRLASDISFTQDRLRRMVTKEPGPDAPAAACGCGE